jgi:hypothetical protein
VDKYTLQFRALREHCIEILVSVKIRDFRIPATGTLRTL